MLLPLVKAVARIPPEAARATRRLARAATGFAQGLGVTVKPLAPIPHPTLDIAAATDPIAAILAAPEFKDTVRWFADNPAAQRSLVSPDTQALLFAMVRNLKPAHVFEIGTYRCGSSEAICRALYENGVGTLHTVDPFGRGIVPGILLKWPEPMRRHVHYHALDSMAFYMLMTSIRASADVIFIDGNHEYEFALFDLQAAARHLAPGGFLLLDNVSQPGPFFAAVDFMRANRGWQECGDSLSRYRTSHPFDRNRTTIHNTDLLVLRAPRHIVVAERPQTTGQRLFRDRRVSGMTLAITSRATSGTLTAQCVLRGFGRTLVEVVGETSLTLADTEQDVTIRFSPPIVLDGEFAHATVEPWLAWDGEAALLLAEPPAVF
jgi:predicted O-methyltransferase YrrM